MRLSSRVLLAQLFVLCFASIAPAQQKGGPLPPDQALAAMKPADGFQVELFASEPMLINPTSIDVDHKGRVWVAEAVNYRRKPFGRPTIREGGDRIQVLIDTNADGKADEAKTFYQSPEIIAPLSVCVIPQADGKALRVLVAQSPDILELWDKDGDLKADGPPKKFLSGFRGVDHDHGVHGLSVGPDGKLYFTVGDSGVGGLQSSDGKGKKWTSNDTDVQKGTVWRCDLDGTNLELIAHNFRNNYEACVDSFGEIWLSDNDDDGNQQTRICFVFPGGNYGYGPRGAGQSHWHEEQPGIVHKTLRTGFGSPTGITFYEGKMFPDKYTGALLHTDAGPREVRAFFRKPKGAGYELDKEVILTSSDNWFRPSDVCVAPDGSIFVADWYDRGVGGHGMGDPTDGRIYRITPKGQKGYKVPEVKLDTKEGMLAALGSPGQATRALAISKLGSMKLSDAGDILVAGCTMQKDTILRLRAANVITKNALNEDPKKPDPKLGDQTEEVGRSLGGDPDDRVRAFAITQMGDLLTSGNIPPDLAPQVFDLFATIGKEATFREILIASRPIPADKLIPLFYRLAKKYDGQDIFYRAALNIACGTDPARRDAILADFDKHFPEWNDKVADLVWELRPKSVLPRLGKLLADDKLTATQKARIIDIIAANEDPAAGQSMLAVLKSDAAPEVKARAIESLKLFLPTKWQGLKSGKELAAAIDALLSDAKTTATGLQLIAAAGTTNQIDAVAKIAADEKAELSLRKEAVRTLGQLPSDKSVGALTNLGAPKNALSVDCVNALGELLPRGAKGGPAYTQKALESLQLAITLESATLEIKSAALSALAGNRVGTGWLLDAHQKGELPKELVEQTGRLLRNSPFQGERNRALLLFPAPGKLNLKNLPAIAELAKRSGDAARGKAVWNASLAGAAQCAKCHMLRGVGGQVGPDLSMIGKKSAREALYESILQPSKAIADQYLQHAVTTTNEVTVSGLLVAETPTSITLRDANGKDTTIPKKEIDGAVRKLKVSIMPEDIVAALNEDELADMVAYLETLKIAAYTPDVFSVAGPFAAKDMATALDTEFGPEKAAFDAAGKFGEHAWKSIRPDGKGYFDLAALHGNAGNNSASYMYTEVESPADQAGEVLLGVDDGARLWVNGKEVFVSRETKAASPEQYKVPVQLKKGANSVLLKVANGNNPHGFYFSLASAEELKPVAKK